ncbi:MAG: MBL fold metallo-hydrolase [Gracilibacteraceae bacterium]|jgi:glyoxylase-like metal-dependent hydrolase (beta-lactamase superfamily II)|nr:MBL fold metallo-hydrolase [Gracilibacteraceae bacterium]
MAEKLFENIYQIPVPLPGNSLKALNAYLIRGERSLLIDTGFNLDICEKAILDSLAELGVKKETLDILITHFHPDHAGLLPRLLAPETLVYSGSMENLLPDTREAYLKMARNLDYRMSEADMRVFSKPETHFGWNVLREHPGCRILKEGETVSAGGSQWQVIETDGHCAGHICLYEQERKILIAGDHILAHISPNVASFSMEAPSPLREYLRNLDRIGALEVAAALPGHNEVIKNHRQRIRELHEHHEARLQEIVTLLAAEPLDCLDLAGRLTWALPYDDWESFPMMQKYFTFGETVAHVTYLMEEGRIALTPGEGKGYTLKLKAEGGAAVERL